MQKVLLYASQLLTNVAGLNEYWLTKPDYYAKIANTKEWIIFPWERNEFRNLMLKK